MNRPMLSGFILGACALSWHWALRGRDTTSSTGATAEKAPASGEATSNQAAASKHSAHQHPRHHATGHASGHKQPVHTSAAAPASSQDAAYQTALRSCVEGPAGQRDSCLDSTISRFGRS